MAAPGDEGEGRGHEQQDLRGGPLAQSAVVVKVERAQRALIDAVNEAATWHKANPTALAVHAVAETASALKKIRKLHTDLLEG